MSILHQLYYNCNIIGNKLLPGQWNCEENSSVDKIIQRKSWTFLYSVCLMLSTININSVNWVVKNQHVIIIFFFNENDLDFEVFFYRIEKNVLQISVFFFYQLTEKSENYMVGIVRCTHISIMWNKQSYLFCTSFLISSWMEINN